MITIDYYPRPTSIAGIVASYMAKRKEFAVMEEKQQAFLRGLGDARKKTIPRVESAAWRKADATWRKAEFRAQQAFFGDKFSVFGLWRPCIQQ